jgi:hypothetical protein
MNTLLAIALVAIFGTPVIHNFDIEAHQVTGKSTIEGGIYFQYTLKNTGTEDIAGGEYTVKLKVNGKTVSFDKATGTMKAGQSIQYVSSHTFYEADSDKLAYELIIKAKDDNRQNNVLTGTVSF